MGGGLRRSADDCLYGHVLSPFLVLSFKKIGSKRRVSRPYGPRDGVTGLLRALGTHGAGHRCWSSKL